MYEKFIQNHGYNNMQASIIRLKLRLDENLCKERKKDKPSLE